MTDYRNLADIIDYWFGPWQLQKNLGGMGLQHPTQEVARWRQRQETQTLARANQLADNNSIDGLSIVLPISIHEDCEDNFQLKSLIVGFEIRDFMSYTYDLLLLLAALGEKGPRVAFIYIAPLLPGHRCFRKEVFRASKDNAQSFAKGEPPQEMWLFPVEAPHGLLSLLPDVTENVLEELHLINAVLETVAQVLRQQRLQHEARQYLDQDQPFEDRLLQTIEINGIQVIERQSSILETQLQAMETFMPPSESKILWQEFITQFRVKVAAVQYGQEAITDIMPVGSETERAFYTYLNSAYLNLRPS